MKKLFLFLSIVLVFAAACTPETAVTPDAQPQTETEDTAVPTKEPAVETAPETVTETSTEAAPTAEPEPESTTDTTAKPQASPPLNADPGLACLSSSGDGVTCLTTDGQWLSFTTDNSDLGGNYVTAMTVCHENSILMAHTSGMSLFDGQNFSQIPKSDTASSPDAVACDSKGGIWMAHFQGVSYYNGGSWTTYDSSHLGNENLVYDVKVTADNTAWVLTSGTIASYDGSEWTVYETGSGLDDTYFFENLAIAPDGSLWASHSSGLLHLENGAWQSYEKDDYNSPQGLAVDGNGRIWMGSLTAGLSVFDGSVWSNIDTESSDLSSNDVQALVVDGNGRVWAGTSYGISIYNGKNWQTYRMDNADLLNHDISAIAVIDGGPKLPAPAAKTNGSLTGYLTQDGTPLSDTMVEICVESLYSYFSGDTPCSDQPFFRQTTTDADGIFNFNDIPVGQYVLVAALDNGFAQLTNDFGIGSEMIPVFEGEATDIGEITITAEE